MKTLLEYLRLFMFRWFGHDPKPERPTEIWTTTDPVWIKKMLDAFDSSRP